MRLKAIVCVAAQHQRLEQHGALDPYGVYGGLKLTGASEDYCVGRLDYFDHHS